MASKGYLNDVYNGAAAYDLYGSSAYKRPDPLPQERPRTRARQQAPALDLTAVLCIVMAFGAILLMLFSYVRVYEANTRCSDLEKKLSELQEQRDQLSSRYDSMLDLRAIEVDAIERLGMTKPFGEQTVYVNLSGTDRGEVLDATGSALEDAAQIFREAFSALGAYLSE